MTQEPVTEVQAAEATPESMTDAVTTQAVETISLDEAKKLRQEAQSLRRRMHEYEAKAKAEEEAKLSETERLKKQLDEVQATLSKKVLDEMKRKAAQQAGLPEQFTDRLHGSTEDELVEDAMTLSRSMPKAAPAQISPTNPGVTPKLTMDAIKAMTPNEINANWDAVQAVLSRK